ncbi:MAG: sigma-70 family RNA polymerase sigma factor [Balneolales bacterium]
MVIETNRSGTWSNSSNSKPGQIWSNIQLGNKDAFTQLYTLYYRQLFNYGFKMTLNEELVKDCIQELFLTMWNQREMGSEIYCMKSYLICSMRRIVLRQIKKQKNCYERNRQYIDSFLDNLYGVEDLDELDEVTYKRQQKLNKAIHSLSTRQKEAVYLKYYDGLTNSEISYVMEINLQSVYNHISGAVRQLQGLVQG